MAAFPRTRLPLPCPPQETLSALTPPSAASKVFGTPELLELIIEHLPVPSKFRAMRVDCVFHNTIAGSSKLRTQMFLDVTCRTYVPDDHPLKRNPLLTDRLARSFRFDLRDTLNISDLAIVAFSYWATGPKPTLELSTESREAALTLLNTALPPTFLDMAVTEPCLSSELCLTWPTNPVPEDARHPPVTEPTFLYSDPSRSPLCVVEASVRSSSPCMWLKVMRTLVEHGAVVEKKATDEGWDFRVEESVGHYWPGTQAILLGDPVYRISYPRTQESNCVAM